MSAVCSYASRINVHIAICRLDHRSRDLFDGTRIRTIASIVEKLNRKISRSVVYPPRPTRNWICTSLVKACMFLLFPLKPREPSLTTRSVDRYSHRGERSTELENHNMFTAQLLEACSAARASPIGLFCTLRTCRRSRRTARCSGRSACQLQPASLPFRLLHVQTA